jgi:hypothetical protein
LKKIACLSSISQPLALACRNAVRAVDLFRIPTDNFIEMGRLVEI